MNKKLMVVAVAGALAAPLVASAQSTQSTVTIFGSVAASYDSVQIDQAAGVTNADRRQEQIGDNYGRGRFGFLVKEDLGGGFNANARIEFAFRAGTGTADAAREQWVGLSGKNWGSVKFGRVQSVFKDFAGGGGLDPLNTTALQARGSGGAQYTPGNGFGNGAFVDHAIRYESPAFAGGFSAAVLLSPSDATQADPTIGAANGGNVGGNGGTKNYQLGLKYKFGSAGEIFGGYSVDDANTAQRAVAPVNGRTADDETVWRIGGSWSFGNFKIAGQYDDIESALAGNGGTTCGGGGSGSGNEAANAAAGGGTQQCLTSLNTNGDGKIWFLTTQYKMGNTTFIVQGGQTTADAIGVQLEREAKNITVGVIHALSKRSSIYGGFQRVSVENASSTGSLGGANAAAGFIQPDRSVWTLGVRHDF